MAIQILPREGSFMQSLGSAIGGGAQAGVQQYQRGQELQQQQLMQVLPMLQKMQKEQQVTQANYTALINAGASPEEAKVMSKDPALARKLIGAQSAPSGFIEKWITGSPRPFDSSQTQGQMKEVLERAQGGAPSGTKSKEGVTQQQQASQKNEAFDIQEAHNYIDNLPISDTEKQQFHDEIANLQSGLPSFSGALKQAGIGILSDWGGIPGSIQSYLNMLKPEGKSPGLAEILGLPEEQIPAAMRQPDLEFPTGPEIQQRIGSQPKNWSERFIRDLTGLSSLLANPESMTAKGILKAVPWAFARAGTAKGAGWLTEKVTGSEAFGEAVTLGTIFLSGAISPKNLKNISQRLFSNFEGATQNSSKRIFPSSSSIEKVNTLRNELESGGAVNDISRKLMNDRIFEVERTIAGPNQKAIDMHELYKVQKDHASLLKNVSKDDLYKRSLRKLVKIEDGALEKFGKTAAPSAWKDFTHAKDLIFANALRKDVAANIKKSTPSRPLMGFLSRILWKPIESLGTKGLQELNDFMKYEGVRRVYADFIKAGAANNSKAIIRHGDKLIDIMKKKSPELYQMALSLSNEE